MVNRRNIRITVSVITVIFLLALVLLFAFSDGLAYDRYRKQRSDNASLYITDLRDAVESKDYIRVARIVDGNDISLSRNEGTESFRYAVSAARNYSDLFTSLMKVVTGYSTSYSESTPGYMRDSLQYIFKYAKEGREYYPEYEDYYDAIERDTVLLVKTYLGISEEDAANLKDYTAGKLGLVIEEAFYAKTGQN